MTSTDTISEGVIESLEAFNELITAHQHTAYSIAYRFLGSRSSAEDVVQDALLRAYAARARFRGGDGRAWLLKIVANVARDELRRRRRRPQASIDSDRDGSPLADLLAEPTPGPETQLLQADLRVALEYALMQLPEDSRLAVILVDVQGLSYGDAALLSGVPCGTIKSRVSRARGRLRDLLTESGELRELPNRAQPIWAVRANSEVARLSATSGNALSHSCGPNGSA